LSRYFANQLSTWTNELDNLWYVYPVSNQRSNIQKCLKQDLRNSLISIGTIYDALVTAAPDSRHPSATLYSDAMIIQDVDDCVILTGRRAHTLRYG